MGKLFSAALIFIVVSALVVAFGLFRFNHFRSYEDYSAVSCTPVVGVPGVEDAAADPRLGQVWLSSLERGAGRAQDGALRGQVIAFDPENPLAVESWRDRTAGVPAAFQPLGIDLYDDGQVRRLFVVNEADLSILVYSVAGNNDLALIETLRDSRLTSPNAVVATGPNSFYVSNSTGARHGSLHSAISFLFGHAGGSVLHFDGEDWHEAASDLKFANGLALSADGTRLYVAETSARRIGIFERAREDGQLTAAGQIPLATFPDNLSLQPDASLLVGAMPKPVEFAAYLRGRQATASSQLLRLSPPVLSADEAGAPETVFVDDGETLSGLTVGTHIGGKLVLGAFAENKFLLCDSPVAAESRAP